MSEFLRIMGDSFRELGGSIRDAFLGAKEEEHSSSFGNEREVLSSHNTGFAVTSHKYLGKEEQIISVGGTGAGKSSNCITPCVVNQKDASMLVIDNSGGVKKQTHAPKIEDGYKAFYLDFDPKEFTTETMFYNPLANLEEDDRSGIAKVTSLLIGNMGDKKDYWMIKAQEVVNLAIIIVLKLPEQQRHLYNVLLCVEQMASEEETMSEHIAGLDERSFRAWKLILANSANTKDSILSSAISMLSWIGNSPTLAKLCSRNTLDFQDLRRHKICVYIRVPIGNAEVVQPLVNLFFSQFYNHFLNSPLPEDNERRIMVLADEFGSMTIPQFPKILSNCRKWLITNHLIVQSLSQLSQIYNKDGREIILANVSQMYMAGMDEEADLVSKSLGTKIITDSESDAKRRVPLYSADQLRTMKGEAIVKIKGHSPLKVRMKPYFKDRRMLKRIQLILDVRGIQKIDVSLNPFILYKKSNTNRKNENI